MITSFKNLKIQERESRLCKIQSVYICSTRGISPFKTNEGVMLLNKYFRAMNFTSSEFIFQKSHDPDEPFCLMSDYIAQLSVALKQIR